MGRPDKPGHDSAVETALPSAHEAETPDAYLDSSDGPMADLARGAGDAHSRARAGPVGEAWGVPCWSGNKRIFSIIAHKAHVNLKLWSGARLIEAQHRRRSQKPETLDATDP